MLEFCLAPHSEFHWSEAHRVMSCMLLIGAWQLAAKMGLTGLIADMSLLALVAIGYVSSLVYI